MVVKEQSSGNRAWAGLREEPTQFTPGPQIDAPHDVRHEARLSPPHLKGRCARAVTPLK